VSVFAYWEGRFDTLCMESSNGSEVDWFLPQTRPPRKTTFGAATGMRPIGTKTYTWTVRLYDRKSIVLDQQSTGPEGLSFTTPEECPASGTLIASWTRPPA
jgi:hypothetical protein